jgi:hypothetical protein
MDVTMLFLIGSVSVIWNHLFQAKFGFWLIILVLLIAFGLIGGYQNQTKGKTIGLFDTLCFIRCAVTGKYT